MGHNPGFPCVHEDPNHTGGCSSIIVGPVPADLDKTRYFEVTEAGNRHAYWRTNATALRGNQVEHLHPDGKWRNSWLFDTEREFERNLERDKPVAWREITAEEVPDVSEQDRLANGADSLFVDTQDAATRYREDHQ